MLSKKNNFKKVNFRRFFKKKKYFFKRKIRKSNLTKYQFYLKSSLKRLGRKFRSSLKSKFKKIFKKKTKFDFSSFSSGLKTNPSFALNYFFFKNFFLNKTKSKFFSFSFVDNQFYNRKSKKKQKFFDFNQKIFKYKLKKKKITRCFVYIRQTHSNFFVTTLSSTGDCILTRSLGQNKRKIKKLKNDIGSVLKTFAELLKRLIRIKITSLTIFLKSTLRSTHLFKIFRLIDNKKTKIKINTLYYCPTFAKNGCRGRKNRRV